MLLLLLYSAASLSNSSLIPYPASGVQSIGGPVLSARQQPMQSTIRELHPPRGSRKPVCRRTLTCCHEKKQKKKQKKQKNKPNHHAQAKSVKKTLKAEEVYI